MTLFEAYQDGLKLLKNPQNDEINIRVLLCENNNLKSMSDFYLHKNENIKDLQRFNRELHRFLSGEPVQYITGKASFFGDDFVVSKDVLIPRNETEEVVDYAIKKIKEKFGTKNISISDVCTGSGCIGCELFLHSNVDHVFFSDISDKAIAISKQNAEKLNVKGSFCVADGLDYLNHSVDVVVSNPPYILKKEDVDQSVLDFEPRLALFTDEDLTIYRKIAKKAIQLGVPLIIFEIGYDIKEKLEKIFKEIALNYTLEFKKDINDKFRICSLSKID